MVLILLLLLSVVSYTWFSLSKTPRISNLSMHITTRNGLELSLDVNSEQWGNQLSFLDMVNETSPLRPVTWSERDQMFYSAVIGFNGRLTGEWLPLSDEQNANRDTNEGYYCIGTFYARSSEAVTVSLTPAVEVESGIMGAGTYLIGTPEWDPDKIAHQNAGYGAENAVRVGIKITHLNEQNLPSEQPPIFYIYEPNCDAHVDGASGYIATPSIHGEDNLVPEERLITQTRSTWIEAQPVENGKQVYTFGEFTSSTELFSLEAGAKAMIQLYIWLEGQDVDCVGTFKEAHITANIQFVTERKNDQPGLKPIE